MKYFALVLLSIPQLMALRPPIIIKADAPSSRRSIMQAAALTLVAPALPAAAVEMYSSASSCVANAVCSSNGKTQLASYDEMLLKRTTEELCAADLVFLNSHE